MKKYIYTTLFILVLDIILFIQIGCTKPQSSKTILVLGYYALPGAPEKVMQQLITIFESKHPDIKVVTHVSPYEEFYQKLKTEIAANTAPDVWLADGVFVPSYVSRGVIKDLTPWIDRDLKRNDYLMLESSMDSTGRIWAFPQGLEILVLFYNKKLFNEAKIAYPTKDWTLDDLLSAAKKLTKNKNADRQIGQYGISVTTNITNCWFPIIKAFGGTVLDKSLTHSELDNPKTIAGIQFMCDLINKYKVAPSQEDITAFGGFWNIFPSGLVAMQYGLYARSITLNNIGMDYDVEMLPKGPAGRVVPVNVNTWVIYNKSTLQKQAAAWEWIKYYSSKEPQIADTKMGQSIPINREVAYSDAFLGIPTPPHNRQVFLDSLPYAVTLDINNSWEEWEAAVDDTLDQALRGKIDAKTAAELADKKVQKILDRVNKENNFLK